MNKKRLHHYYRYSRPIKPQYILLAAAVSSVIAVGALRHNSQTMADLRQQVYIADEQDGDVQGALSDLQKHVTAHMNTDLVTADGIYPPIQLPYTYERLVRKQAAANSTGTNEDLYTRAQEYCQNQNSADFSGRNRVPCIQQYIADNGSGDAPISQINPSLYQFNFVSPRWSPDLAGWSLLVSVLLVVLAVVKFAIDARLRRYLR